MSDIEIFLVDKFGESCAEDILDAICFYLLNSNDFPSRYTKFDLLSIVKSCDYLMKYTKTEFNPLYHFDIIFNNEEM